MRNLKLQYCKQYEKTLLNVRFLLLNPNEIAKGEIVFMATINKLFAFDTVSQSLTQLVELPGIIGCDYLALENEICIATESGEVLLVNPQTKATTEGTFCEVGIKQMEWSPDQEVVVFVTKGDSVVVMSCRFEPISEQSLADIYFGSGQFISVGWGKKETQFHGSEGKPKVIKGNDTVLESSSMQQVEELAQDIVLSWRADAAYFCVSYVDQKVGRTVKIFDKEGSLKYTCEKLQGLQPPVAWRPCGTWMAIPQRLSNKSTIALLEKNGLRHREIVLPFSLETEPIHSLKWSPDSDVLCLETRDESNHNKSLYFYTINNYHWYLKQVLNFNSENPIEVYCWDNRIGEEKTLHILLANGQYLLYRFHFNIDKHSVGVVAVIDGKRLLITDLAQSLVPPPMCNQELSVEDFVNESGFIINDQNELILFAYDAAAGIHIFKSSCHVTRNFSKVLTLTPDDSLSLMSARIWANVIWFNSHNLVTTTSFMNRSKLLFVSLNEKSKTHCVSKTLILDGTANALCRGSKEQDQHIFVQFIDGRIQQISDICANTINVESPYHRNVHIQGGVVRMEWFSIEDTEHKGLVSLQTNQRLYINAQCIADDVTSFCLAGNYLAFTTLITLHFVRLCDRRIVSERKIERGSKLVTIITGSARTVFQLPRGNLETINPRVLSLELIGALLEKEQYHLAMDILRKQRINLNIICDHNMQHFMENLKTFLYEIQNPNWLSLFISDLQNEDFTKSMYASNYQPDSQAYPEGFKIEQKVVYLCEKLCELMEKEYEPRFRLPIITAYVKINKAEKALQIIWEQKQNEDCIKRESQEAADALKYLLYLIDINELYNIALGTYDFGLVLFVAQKSQKDPREFLPFLNELRSLEPNYRKYKIDAHLKRYEKALQNIALCGEAKIEEALEFVKQHELFRQALKFYRDHDKCYEQICNAFGDHLRAKGKLENASIMYERGNNISQALLCAKNALDWKRALTLAKRLDEKNVQSVALSMVSALEEHGMYWDAFELLKTFGNNFLDAIKCLLKAKYFSRAIFEAKMKTSEEDIIVPVIKPDLMAYSSLLQSNLSADQELFMSYKERLIEIRQEKLNLSELKNTINEPAGIDECDLLSDTTSMNSSRYTGNSRGSTGKTFRSSKNRRKHERKLLSLKPGNPFEDIALVDALYNQVTKASDQQQHIHDICKALMELREDDVASVIQNHLKALLTLIQNSLDEIWIPEMMTDKKFLVAPSLDYTQLQNEQRYCMLSPQKRYKPQLIITDWEHEILH